MANTQNTSKQSTSSPKKSIAEAFDILLFGATGDLAQRKLMRAMYRRVCAGQIPDGSKIFAIARSDLTTEAYLEQVRGNFEKFLGPNECKKERGAVSLRTDT